MVARTFKYDPFGRRIEKVSPTTTSIYAYDGDNLVEETNSSGTAVARYSPGLNIDEPLSMLRSSTTSYYEADGLGSITSLSSGSGSLAETYSFDSFGKQTASSGSLTNPFQYTARESDPETGLYYYRARYYDPGTGRFTREDPIGFYGGDVDLYRYVWNSSTNFIDPDGEWGIGLSLGVTGEAGLIAVGAGATGSVGGGVFFNGPSPSIGGFASGGAFAGGPGWGASAPSLPSRNNGVLGAFAGGGLGIWATNAKNVGQLAGPFKTYSVNAGWFLRAATLQFSIGKDACGKTIWMFNYGGPLGIPSGIGWGGSGSAYNTNTKTKGKGGEGGGDCGCN
jgi:RHS repeat-associated protein